MSGVSDDALVGSVRDGAQRSSMPGNPGAIPINGAPGRSRRGVMTTPDTAVGSPVAVVDR
ncbi:MAG: hypothetical protein JHC84_12630 [Solirubrobacteraceae bacterium]|nr:hypothetical protein [Solirubrobacteraceae bacterium]